MKQNDVKVTQLPQEELIRLKELPPLPPTGSDGQRLKPPFRIPQRKRK